MKYPETKIACVSNLWIRMMHFKNKDDQNEDHVHNFDHVTLLSKGSLEVTVDGNKTIFTAPSLIYVSKGKSHYLKALEDGTVASCLHALRSGEREEDIIDPSMIPNGITIDDIFNNNVRPL